MSKFEEIVKDAKSVSLLNTETFLKQLYSSQRFTIKSNYPTINSIFLDLEKGDRCFTFKAGQILPFGPTVKYQNKGYGFEDSFELLNEINSLCVPKGVKTLQISFVGEYPIQGEIAEISSCKLEKSSFYRAIIPLAQFNKKPYEHIESKAFKSGSWIRRAGFIELAINGYAINFLDCKVNDKESLIIECLTLIDFQTFEKIVVGIIYSFGLISGSLIRNEVIFLQYSDNTLENVLGFSFRRIENSLNGITSIDPRIFAQASGSKKIGVHYLPPIIFQTLVENCIKDPRFLRAVKMITESAAFPLEIRASTYSVALETLKNIIIEENELKINPFKNKRKATETIKELKKIVELMEDQEFNNKKSVINKLDQLNQVGNKEGFLLSFKLLSIPLSPDDERCLVERNNFLHGKIPFENEMPIKNYEIQHIVYKLHMLLCALVLKYSGYKGFILNNIKLIDLMYFKKNINEPLLRQI